MQDLVCLRAEMDPSHGVDITLVWSDVAGSANAK